ncbi:MAG: hypothetical protein ACRENG_31925 [bacterium]
MTNQNLNLALQLRYIRTIARALLMVWASWWIFILISYSVIAAGSISFTGIMFVLLTIALPPSLAGFLIGEVVSKLPSERLVVTQFLVTNH